MLVPYLRTKQLSGTRKKAGQWDSNFGTLDFFGGARTSLLECMYVTGLDRRDVIADRPIIYISWRFGEINPVEQ
jgi:hypothetical protein